MAMPSYILSQALTTVREETRVELARWSSGNALLVGALLSAAGLYAVAWMYRREGRGQLSRRMRVALVACRVMVLVLLGAIGLEPVLTRYIHRRMEAVTLLLVDDSASMSLADRYRAADEAMRVQKVVGDLPTEGVPRAAVAEKLIDAGGAKLIQSLAATNVVKTFTFSDGVIPRLLTSAAGQTRLDANAASRPGEEGAADEAGGNPRNGKPNIDGPGKGNAGETTGSAGESAGNADGVAAGESSAASKIAVRVHGDGPATNFSQAVRSAVDSLGGAPVAAVVVVTDGGFNTGEDPAEVARYLKQRDIPLYAIGVGDPAEPVNVRVAEVAGPRSAFKNDPFTVTVRLEAEGAAGQAVKVDLLEKPYGTNKPAEVVESRTVTVGADRKLPPVAFERKVAKPGAMTYVARTRPLDGELVRTDNEREILPAVQILDDKMRVLVVSGGPTYDYRFLTRMLERDKTVDVSCWLQSADAAAVRDGTTVIKELPTEQADLFKYDAILLLDVNPKELDPTWGSLVATFVADHGGGLLYGAGNKYSGKFFRSPATTAIIDVLPVAPDSDAELVLNELGQFQTRSWPILISDEALNDPILRLADDPISNRAVWAGLDGVFWHYPVRREKPVATALMRHSNPRMVNAFGPHVLLATHYVGAGRTAFLGFDSTWRWRRADEKLFNRFWIQMLRYLVEGKLLGGRARGSIATQKEQFDLGDSVVITARALDERFNPLQLPVLELKAIAAEAARPASDGEDGTTDVGAAAGAANEAARSTAVSLSPIPGREGYYQGRFVPSRTGVYKLRLNLPSTGEGASQATVEKEIVVAQPDIELRQPAMQRDRLRQLAAEAGGKYVEVDEAAGIAALIPDRSRTPPPIRERPRPLWDNRWVLAALVGFLTVEWILRKKAKLL